MNEFTMNREDASALADLQMHWDEAYVISVKGDTWLAHFRGSAEELQAQDSTELRELIRADYARRQQSRATSDRDPSAQSPDDVNFADLRGDRMSI
jgi:hypothetical protein